MTDAADSRRLAGIEARWEDGWADGWMDRLNLDIQWLIEEHHKHTRQLESLMDQIKTISRHADQLEFELARAHHVIQAARRTIALGTPMPRWLPEALAAYDQHHPNRT